MKSRLRHGKRERVDIGRRGNEHSEQKKCRDNVPEVETVWSVQRKLPVRSRAEDGGMSFIPRAMGSHGRILSKGVTL